MRASIATIVVIVFAASVAYAHGPLNAGFPVAGAAPAGTPAGTPGTAPSGDGSGGGTTPAPNPTPSAAGDPSGGTTPTPTGAPLPGGGTGATGALPAGKKATGKPLTSADRARRGRTTRSATALERINVDWFPATLPTVKEGKYAARTLPIEFLADAKFRYYRHRAGIPIMVAMTTEGHEAEEFARSEAKWMDEQVGVASLLFNCYRINLDDMDAAFVKRYGGGKVPVVLFLDEKGEELARLSGWNVDSKRLISTMTHLVKARWNKNLTRIVAREIEILKAFDAAKCAHATESKLLESDVKAYETKPTLGLKKSIAKRRKAIAAAKKSAAKATTAEAKLMSFLGVTPVMPMPKAD